MNGLSVVSEIANQYGNGNVVTTPAEGNGNGINGIQSTQEEFEFMAAADAYKEAERVKVNCTSEDTLQQVSTSRTQSDNAPVYDSDGSTEEINELLWLLFVGMVLTLNALANKASVVFIVATGSELSLGFCFGCCM
nr:hypothetical protein [Tanacetum cinerariifolium]